MVKWFSHYTKYYRGYNILDLAGLDLKSALCGLVKRELGLDIEEYLSYMVYLDAILLNEDRHLRNISIITSEEGYKLTPYYDFGLILLSDKNEYTEIEDIYKVHAQPFSQDFFKQIALFENPKIQIDVKQLFLKLKDAKIYSNRLGIKRFLNETPNKDSIYAIQVVSDKEIIVVARMYNGGYGLSNNGCDIQEFSEIRIDIEEFKENKKTYAA